MNYKSETISFRVQPVHDDLGKSQEKERTENHAGEKDSYV